ncbi:hypothetical protein AAG906_018641 [Vitis piasezkii]
MLVSSPGGRCWFGVELKTFEISIEEHKEKVHGKICERGPKFSSWIRFGGKALMENHTLAQALSSSIIRDSSSLRDCPAPRDVVWIEAEKEALDRNEELLGRCLVGFWEGDSNRLLDLASFGSWAKSSWFLEGNLWLSNVRKSPLELNL